MVDATMNAQQRARKNNNTKDFVGAFLLGMVAFGSTTEALCPPSSTTASKFFPKNHLPLSTFSIHKSRSSRLYYTDTNDDLKANNGSDGQDSERVVVVTKGEDEECIVTVDETARHESMTIDLKGLNDLEPLERQILRMEGFEPYVLVSVLCSTTSYNTVVDIDVFKGGELDVVSTVLLLTSTASTVCGVYATVVFSMCILYGKTALGLGQEDGYQYFLDSTNVQRLRGFVAFRSTLFLFVVDIFLIGIDKLPASVQPYAWAFAATVCFLAYTEFSQILKGAAPIFSGVIPDEECTMEDR